MSQNNENPFPTPAVVTRKSKPKSLDLERVDTSRSGAQGEVFVSKGSAIPHPG
jgi:hypothetical protein